MEEDTEFKKLPVEERVVHKLWKARVHGYEELTKLFRQIDDEKSPEFSKYLGLVKKFVIDSNAMGQEKGLEVTLAYIENYANAGKTVGEVMSGIVSKCIAAPKTKTRELAVQITLMYVEIEKQDAVQEELIKGMDQKNPKIVAACISACTLALKEFGSKVINVKPLIKKMPSLLADRDKTVRDEGKAMVIEIYRWIGGALRSQLANLQPVQVTELETEFSKVGNEKVVPSRYLRSQQEKQAKIAAAEASGDADNENDDETEVDAAPDIDPYELVDPVNILSKLSNDFYEKVEAKKWQDRKEAVEAVENLVKAPKLESGDYGDLVRALKKIISKDTNVMVVATAGKCLAGLANGLKKRFQPYAGACVPALLEKFREKKQNVVLALREALDAIFISTTVESIVDDVLEALNNKNPAVKAETAAFLARAFTRCLPTAVNKKMLKAYTGALLKTLNEPDPTVRDNSAEALGTLMKLVGEKAIGPFVTEVDNLKMVKIKECCDKAVIVVKVPVTKKERPTTAPTKTAAKSETAAPSAAKAPTRRPASTGTVVKKKLVASAAKKGGASTKSSAASKATELEMSADEIDEKAVQLLDEETYNSLSDSNWKTRLAAVEKYQSVVQQLDPETITAQLLVGILNKKPGLKDTNIQVFKYKLETLKIIAETHKFSTVSANLCVNDVTDKLGDVKNSILAGEVLTAIAEAIELKPIVNFVLEYAFNQQKNPKVQQESLLWVSNAIKEFGFNVNEKSVIEICKKGVSATNPAVRTAAITLLGTLYLYMGPMLHNFFQNEKPALKQQINAEFDKYDNEKPPDPIRGLAKNKAASLDNLAEADDDDDQRNEQAKLDDLLPRIDISSQITDALINELSDKNWKVRNEALQKVQSILSESRLIQANIGDLPQALAQRLVDSNGKIVQTAIQICQTLATAMGTACKQHVRFLFPALLQDLSDTKNWIRSAAIQCINAWGDVCGYKEFYDGEMIGDALKSGSPTLRIELWAWIAEKLDKIPVKSIPKEELVVCIPILYTNLEDRNADVRKNAQEAVLPFMIHLGYESMSKQTEKLKPGSKTVVMGVLEKVRPNLPVKPLPKNKQAPIESSKTNSKPAKPDSANKAGGGGVKVRASIAAKPSSGRKKEDDIDTSPLLVANNLKHQRVIDEQKLRVLKWNFTTPREEFVELLKDQMATANVNKTLMANMFHADFRYHLKAIESLTDDIADNSAALISNLDLILKWLTLRFFDTNPSVLLKGLEYLHIVFTMLIESKHLLLENEASSFIPYLILKIGDPKDAVRNGVKSMLKQIAIIYPVSKLFSYIMEGLKSKNARQRAECLDELSSLIENFGTTVCQPNPGAALKEIAKHISDRDNSVRNAALNCIVQGYFVEGDKIYRLIGQISDKDQSLLEERIKRVNKKGVSQKRASRIVVPQQQQQQLSPQALSPASTSNNVSQSPHRDSIDLDQKSDEEQDIAPPPVLTKSSENKFEANKPNAADTIDTTVILEKNMNCAEETLQRAAGDNHSESKQSPSRPISGPFGLDQDLLQKLEKTPAVVRVPQLIEMDLDFMYETIPRLSEIYRQDTAPPAPAPIPKRIIQSVNHNQPIIASRITFVTNPRAGQELFLEKTINQIGSPDLKIALVAIQQMQEVLQTNKINLMTEFEDQFMIAITLQLKLLHSQCPYTNPDVLQTYRALLMLVTAFYETKVLGKKISRDVIKDILYQLITLLVDNKLESISNNDAYSRVINLQCVKIIEKSDYTTVICALIRLLYDCVGSTSSPRFLDLVMKCLWRVIKLIPTWQNELDYDVILYEIHVFFKDFPSAWWKQKPSDTPLRTVKTILHSLAKIKGYSIMQHFTKIPNPNESELQAYLLKLLKSFKLEEVKQIPLKKQVPKAVLTEIFQKIGSKDETREGLALLYDFKLEHPDIDIGPFLERATPFFKHYIEKGLNEIEQTRKQKHTQQQQQTQPNTTLTQTQQQHTTPSVPPLQQGAAGEPDGLNTVSSDDKADPGYWMNRLKKWQNRINATSSTTETTNPLDNKLKDENLNLQQDAAANHHLKSQYCAAAEQDFQNMLRSAEEMRKKFGSNYTQKE